MSTTLPASRALREPDAEAIVAAVGAITDALEPSDVGRSASEQVMTEIPELGRQDDEDLQQAILASATSAVADAWNGLRFDRPLERVTLSTETTALAHEVIRRNIDLATMLRGYRVGHAQVMQHCERAAAEMELDPDVRWRALTRISRYLFGYVDVMSVRGSELFFVERARWLRGAAAARAEIVEALLAGQDVDPERSCTTLGYDLRGTHIAFVLWLDAPPSTIDRSTPARIDPRMGRAARMTEPARQARTWSVDLAVNGWFCSACIQAPPLRSSGRCQGKFPRELPRAGRARRGFESVKSRQVV